MKDGEACYPHSYFLRRENRQEVVLQGLRPTEHGTFRIFDKPCDKGTVYGEHYLGCVEANYWGTAFELFDSGLDESSLAKLPQNFGRLRRVLVSADLLLLI